MILLEGSIHKLKVDFNTKINELKIRKKDIILTVESLHKRLYVINEELETPEELILPTIDETIEYPQKFFDINDDELDTYREEKKAREQSKAQDKKKGLTNRQKKELEKAKEEEKAKAEAEQAAKKNAEKSKPTEEVHIYHRQMAERKDRKYQIT